MFEIQYATKKNKDIWFQYDHEISEKEWLIKIENKRCYLLLNNQDVIGVMRYNFMYDTIPFLTLIYLHESVHRNGFGKTALLYWENEMRLLGFPCVMTSTQSNETAQFFYRKLGYKDTGCLLLDIDPLTQPAEIFFIKKL